MSQEDKQYLVSIITVTKNCAQTIARTLESIRSVKSPEIQYVIVDGESTDGTLDIIRSHGDLVDILISEKDSGIYHAMNKGAMVAEGQYILYLNGDDHLFADGFNKAKTILRNETPEILSCQSEVFSQNGAKLEKLRLSLPRLYFFNTVPHLSTFVSSALQKSYKFREQFKIMADYDLFLRMFLHGHHFLASDLVIATHYRGGFSNNLPQVLVENRQIRRENLGSALYYITRILELLNELSNSFLAKYNVRRTPSES